MYNTINRKVSTSFRFVYKQRFKFKKKKENYANTSNKENFKIASESMKAAFAIVDILQV